MDFWKDVEKPQSKRKTKAGAQPQLSKYHSILVPSLPKVSFLYFRIFFQSRGQLFNHMVASDSDITLCHMSL